MCVQWNPISKGEISVGDTSEAGSGFYSWKDLEYAFKMWPYPFIFVQLNSTSICYLLSLCVGQEGEGGEHGPSFI